MSDGEEDLALIGLYLILHESRAAARTPRDVTVVLFGLTTELTTFTTSLRVAKLRKLGFRAPNIPAQNRI